MGAHFIGQKKILKLSKKFGIDIISGVSLSGTKKYDVLARSGKTYLLDVIENSIVETDSCMAPSLRREAICTIPGTVGRDRAASG